jgi:multidrug efflux pump subunit AcrA (membrane-fusion protein)
VLRTRSIIPRFDACSSLAPVALAACAILGGVLACGGDPPAERPTIAAERSRIERIVIATGAIEPATEVEIRPRIPGIVEKIHVKEGDRVEPGQPLLEIERELLASQVREAQANLESANVELHFAKIALDRTDELHVTGASSDQVRDDAMARFQRGRADRARAQAAVPKQAPRGLFRGPISLSFSDLVVGLPTRDGSPVGSEDSVSY